LCEKPFEVFLNAFLGEWGKEHFSLVIQITSLLFIALGYAVIEQFTGKVFIKDSEEEEGRTFVFRQKSHRILEEKQVQALLVETAKEWTGATWVSLIAFRFKYNEFRMSESFADGSVIKEPDIETLEYITSESVEETKNGRVCHLVDLTKTISVISDRDYPKQIEQMIDHGVEYIQPIYSDDSLYALMLVSKEGKPLTRQEKRSLEVLASISSDAIRNAELFNRVYWESRTDSLTRLGNRMALFERMAEIRDKKEVSSVGVAMIKVDNVRVINQLYGMSEGDRIIYEISQILVKKAGKTARVFRYGTTEFVILMDRKVVEDVRNISEAARNAVMNMNVNEKGTSAMVTISSGVCEIYDSRQCDEKFLDKAALALYTARKRGKNCTVTYLETGGNPADASVSSLNNNLFNEYEAVFRALTAAIDAKDHYTFSHSQNVAYYASELARALNMGNELVETVNEAGLLHDIGKIGIPEAILQKPEHLSPEEYEIIKGHVEQSGAILSHLSGMEYILPAVLGHHERYDGKGYPRGIAGEDIPLSARILCVVDSFDAMVSRRPYKKQYPVKFALNQLMEGRGKQFDPELTEIFVDLVEHGAISVRSEANEEAI
nr:diguanylate cyclase [Lachnospiraceae bacterium]